MNLLNHALHLFCPPDSAIVTSEGEVLHLRSSDPLDYATLGAAAQSVARYCPLKVGDVALLNDPSSGGVRLGDMTFVTKLYDDAGTVLWLARRRNFSSRLISGKSIEEEGVRIPPTAIFQNGQLNEVILGAMQGHPLCPPDLHRGAEEVCAETVQQVGAFKRLIARHKVVLTKNSLKAYLDQSTRWAHEKIQEASSGDARAEIYLDDKEMIRLHLDVHDGWVKMDFGGTTNSTKRFLTENATYGVCFEAVARFYHLKKHLNSGSFSVLQVTKPSQCLLNAKYPAPMNEGASGVKAALQTLIAGALAQIHTKAPQALGAFASIELDVLRDQTRLSVNLPGGAGGKPDEKENFFFAADQKFASGFSVEKWERQLPLRVLRLDYRNSARGNAAHNGGRGLILKMEALQDLQLRWRTDLTAQRPKPVRNSIGGDAGEIHWQKSETSAEAMPTRGQTEWKKNSVLVVSTGNGSGWPLPTKASESD